MKRAERWAHTLYVERIDCFGLCTCMNVEGNTFQSNAHSSFRLYRFIFRRTHWPQVKLILKPPLSWAHRWKKKQHSALPICYSNTAHLCFVRSVVVSVAVFLARLRCIQTNVKMCVHIAERSFINSRSSRLWNSQAAFIPTFHVRWIEHQRPNPNTNHP